MRWQCNFGYITADWGLGVPQAVDVLTDFTIIVQKPVGEVIYIVEEICWSSSRNCHEGEESWEEPHSDNFRWWEYRRVVVD